MISLSSILSLTVQMNSFLINIIIEEHFFVTVIVFHFVSYYFIKFLAAPLEPNYRDDQLRSQGFSPF